MQIFIDRNRNGVRDPDEGVNGLLITFRTADDSWTARTVTQDGFGKIVLPKFKAGTVIWIRIPYIHQVAQIKLDAGKSDIEIGLGIDPAEYPLYLP